MSTKIEMMLDELQEAAGQVGIKISYEKMTGLCAGKGGLCRVDGEYRIIADRKSTVQERLDILLTALCGFDLEGIYLSPRTRQALEQAAGKMSQEKAKDPSSTPV